MEVPKKDRIWTRWAALKNERQSWDGHWREISRNVLPRSSRFLVTERNRGGKKGHNDIYDNSAQRALKVLAAGLMAGMTSPARPWFRLTLSDRDLLKHGPVQIYLAEVTRIMLRIFAVSNTYRALHSMYLELGAFGTAASIIQPNFQHVIHHTPLTVGEYAVSVNGEGMVDTLYREFQKPVGAVVREFGESNVSNSVKRLFANNQLDEWVTLVHSIEPRLDRDESRRDSKNMPFRSVYFELEGDREKYLSESGFRAFPAVVPRWEVTGGDIYGSSPGMEALGDIKQLQHEQLRKAQGIDYMSNPPVQAPTSMKGQEINTLPGGMSFVDSANPQGGIRTAFEVRLDLDHLLQDIVDVRGRINSAFYADLFLMLASQPISNMTATEVAERHEEKLLMLGPVLERLHNELLDPLIEMTFQRMADAGILPPPPPELEGMELNVEFVSMLAQAQRAIANNSVDRFIGNVGVVSQIKPEVLDNLDADAWFESYREDLGVNPELQVNRELRDKQRAARAQQQQVAQQQALAESNAKIGRDAGGVATQGGASNAAADIMNQYSGYASPGAESYG